MQKQILIMRNQSPSKMPSSPLILIARRNESNWSSCILGSLQRKRGGPLLLLNAAWNISDSVMTSTSLGAFGGRRDFCDM